jgi:hypothetical protein
MSGYEAVLEAYKNTSKTQSKEFFDIVITPSFNKADSDFQVDFLAYGMIHERVSQKFIKEYLDRNPDQAIEFLNLMKESKQNISPIKLKWLGSLHIENEENPLLLSEPSSSAKVRLSKRKALSTTSKLKKDTKIKKPEKISTKKYIYFVLTAGLLFLFWKAISHSNQSENKS